MRNAVACSLVLGALVLLGPSAQAQLLKRWPLSRAGSSSSASALLGSEVASVCRELGLPVTVMERGTAPLVGALGGVIGAIAAEMLRDHGVDLRTGIGVKSLEGGN